MTAALSLRWDFREGESRRLEEDMGVRLTSEKTILSFPFKWKQAGGEFSEEGRNMKKTGMRDERKK